MELLFNNNQLVIQAKPHYYDYCHDIRLDNFKKSFELLLQNNTNENTYNIVELGTSRSFVSGRIENNKDFYNPQDPSSWDWGAGIFTKVFNDNLLKYNSNFVLYTIDPCENALYVSKTMNNNSNNIKFIKDYSTNFLNNIDFIFRSCCWFLFFKFFLEDL